MKYATAKANKMVIGLYHWKDFTSNFFRCKVFNVCVSADKMQLLTHPSKTYHTHLHAMIRTHNFDPNTVLGFWCMCKVVKPNVEHPMLNSTFGIFSDRVYDDLDS